MYYPIYTRIKQNTESVKVRVEKGVTAEYTISETVCSCGFIFKLPIGNIEKGIKPSITHISILAIRER